MENHQGWDGVFIFQYQRVLKGFTPFIPQFTNTNYILIT